MPEPSPALLVGQSEHWTREELATVAAALSEFRDEYGPGEPALAERVNAVLRGPGDRFVIVPVEPEGDDRA